MEFLKLIETLTAEEASIKRLFGGEGTRVHSGRRTQDPRYKEQLNEAAKLVADVMQGRKPIRYLVEAMSTSDFPTLFGDIIDRTLLAGFRAKTPIWPQIARRREVRDFREVKLYTLDGAEGQLEQVPELTEYPEGALVEGDHSLRVYKYGRRLPFSWETFVNDDLDALRDMPARLGRGARRTEDKTVTQQFVDVNGPHASLYSNGNGNIVNVANGAATNNPPLTLAALQQAYIVLSEQRDEDDEPIELDVVKLVVPPALEIVAQNILNALTIEMTEAGGTAAQKLIAKNWMSGKLQLVVDPYIPIVASTANGNTSWFLFADPNDNRPAIIFGLLRGHTEPETFIKDSNARRVGGGDVPPEEGDFDLDGIHYKVRHVMGAARVEPKMTVASNGSAA